MDNPEKFESFEQVLFFMLKNAIKQASYELMMETEPQELSEEELEEMYEKLLDPVDEPKQLPLERMQEMIQDYNELGTFADCMNKIGFFKDTSDVIELLNKPVKYKQQYLLWVELGRPTEKDETFERFGQAVWNREKL